MQPPPAYVTSLIPAVLLVGSLRVIPSAQPTATTPAVLRAEIARGAAAITAVIAKKHPYSTTYSAIRHCLEKNVQEYRDSEGFSVGANLAVAFWLAQLPEDLSWRAKALAQHRDILQWMTPQLGLPADEVAHTVARAAHFTPTSEQQLTQFLQQTLR